MENRRQHYRHPFLPTERLKVALQAQENAPPIPAEIVNLSLGGMCVDAASLPSSDQNHWIAVMQLATDAPPFRIPAERIDAPDGSRANHGFRFLLPADLRRREEQERILWKFLLEEQIRERQREKGR